MDSKRAEEDLREVLELAFIERKKPTDFEIERYTKIVKEELERWGLEWVVDAVGGEGGLRKFVREVLRRMPKDFDADRYKWDALAQSARDFVDARLSADANIEAWLHALSQRAELLEKGYADLYLPPPEEEVLEQHRALVEAIESIISDALKTMTIEDIRRLLAEKFPQIVEIRDLLRERDVYKRKAEEKGLEARAKDRALKKTREELKRSEVEIKRLQTKIKELEAVVSPKALDKYRTQLRELEEENKKLRERLAQLEEEKRKAEEEAEKAREEAAKREEKIREEAVKVVTEAPPDYIAVRFLRDYSCEVAYKETKYTISGTAGDVVYIPSGLYETIKHYIDRGVFPKFIEPLSVEEKAEIEKVRTIRRIEGVVLTDEEYKKLWNYFVEMVTKKFRLSMRYVYAYSTAFEDTVERTVSYEENMKRVDKLLEEVARETLLMPKVKARKIIEEKPARWVRRPPIRVPEVAIPLPPPVEIPKEPIEPTPFPRRLASSEINIFINEFKRRLIAMGLNPDNYISYWIAFRDAWHGSWEDVLKRFEELIRIIERGLPPPVYFRPMFYPWGPWKEIPRDPVLHYLCTREAKNIEELIEWLREDGVEVTPDDVKRIVKEEWKKGENMHTWLKCTPRDYIKKILGVDPEDC